MAWIAETPLSFILCPRFILQGADRKNGIDNNDIGGLLKYSWTCRIDRE